MIKEIYGRTWYLEKEERFRECKGSNSRIWREDEYRSKTIRKVIKKIYSENIIWMRW